jgi:hypothetical protein
VNTIEPSPTLVSSKPDSLAPAPSVPELPPFAVLPILAIAALFVVAILRKKKAPA